MQPTDSSPPNPTQNSSPNQSASERAIRPKHVLARADPDREAKISADLTAEQIAQIQAQLQQERLARQRAEAELETFKRLYSPACAGVETALQKSEARYRRLIETATEGIWVLDGAGNTQFANGRLAQLLGYPVEALMGRSLLDFVHADSQTLAENSLHRAGQGRQTQQDVRFLRQSGQDLWAIISVSPIVDAQGDDLGILAMVTDITDRKQTQTALESSLCLLQTTLESMADGILSLDGCDRILNLNHRFIKQWNLPDTARSFTTYQQILDPTIAQLKQPDRFLEQLETESERPDLESYMILELQDDRIFERYSKPLKLENRVIGRVINCREITEQRRAAAALAEREALLRTVVSNTPTILYAINREGVFTLAEGKGLDAIGGQPGQVVGQSAFELYHDHPKILADLQRVLDTEEAFNSTLEMNGLFFDNRVTPLYNDQGDLIELVCVATDITAQLQAEEALRCAKADLERRVEERTSELQRINEQLQQEIAQRKQIEQSLRESQVCLRLMNSISTGSTAGLSLTQIIESTVDDIALHFSDLRVLYSVIEADQVEVLYSAQPETMPSLKGLVDRYVGASDYLKLLKHRQSVIVEDVEKEPLLSAIAARMIGRKTRALLAVPLQHSATHIGLLCFNAPQPKQWNPYEIATLTEVADHVSIVLQEAQARQERQRAEERLRLFESVVINGSDAVIITNADLDNPTITYVNAAFANITGFTAAEVIGQTPRILQGPRTDRDQLARIRLLLTQRKSVQVELINYRKDGTEFWVDLTIIPIIAAGGDVSHFVALQRDINDRKWSERTLMAAQARLKYLLSSNPSVIYTCQPTRNRACTFVSENITQQLGYEIWQYLKDSHFWIDHIHPQDLAHVLNTMPRLLEVGELTCEYRFLHQDGSYRWLRDGMKLLRDRHQNPVEIIGSVVDISDRKWAEDQIRASLDEKEVMLKEIHHRVKNNLQVISSLLKLQAGYITDDRTSEVFKESQNRVRAMALIHEKLYQSEDLAKTDFAEYIRSLVTDLLRSYSMNSRMVQLDLNVEEVRLSIDTAIPCGLIINELVSNSLKYAFPEAQPGKIGIHLHAQPENRYILLVEDTGIGFPSHLDFRSTKSLGLQLVCNLIKQLQGTIDLECNQGTRFTIAFAESKPKG
ncbi:PAS domain S-box protein [Myxacorys almedinensis]|uniref:PAS domain S-box protein n=1 Tax=Myxacorys almedinensis A TaxID=2690445 RepID=A0A8J8CPM0_9CYAN|nr:PAS domain S-box protein [Myxacorys almedinensis]NDJ19667.1 PAS domain S-box protein [Myxacorys almedinensis A]